MTLTLAVAAGVACFVAAAAAATALYRANNVNGKLCEYDGRTNQVNDIYIE